MASHNNDSVGHNGNSYALFNPCTSKANPDIAAEADVILQNCHTVRLTLSHPRDALPPNKGKGLRVKRSPISVNLSQHTSTIVMQYWEHILVVS
jgi:hypothetical protein